MTHIALRGTLRFSFIIRQLVALSLGALLCATAHADTTSNIVERDNQYYLYRDGKPLTAGYDCMEIKKNEGYPDFAVVCQNDLQGLLNAQTGKIVLPAEYSDISTARLTDFGLIEARKKDTVHFVTSDGQPLNVPDYTEVGDFMSSHDPSSPGDAVWQGIAERDGKLYVVTLGKGRLISESPAPKYMPIVIMPSFIREFEEEIATKRDGPLNGTYVPAKYPDLQAAWAGWKRHELQEVGQPAIVVRGDVAYDSFGEFTDLWPDASNTLLACQTRSSLELREQDQKGGCAAKTPALFRFVRDGNKALRCVDCGPPTKWIALPPVTYSIIGIGVDLGKKSGETTAKVVHVFPGSPAAQARLLPGDLIAKINGESTESLSTKQISERIRGEAGTSVTLDIIRGSRQFTLDIKRRKITVSELR